MAACGRRSHRGDTNDCVIRSIGIAAEMPYQAVVDGLAGPKYGVKAPRGSRFTGVDHYVQWNYLEELGRTAVYTPDGLSGLRKPEGRLVVDLTMRHTIAVIVVSMATISVFYEGATMTNGATGRTRPITALTGGGRLAADSARGSGCDGNASTKAQQA